MLRKLLVGLLFAASFSAFAFTKEECNTIAENVFYAQIMKNEAPEMFDAVTATIEINPPEAMQWTEKMKKVIMGLVKQLKEGGDPQAVGTAVFKACVNTKDA